MTRLALGLAIASLLPLSGFAQNTAEILGTVSDASGAVIAGAEVKARNLRTNISSVAASDEAGRFRIPQLQPGTYEVEITKAGFARLIQGPIELNVNRAAELTVRLEVSATAETITVASEAALVNTTNAEVGINLDSRRISELPLAPNRNVLNLALLAAGVSTLSSGNSAFAAGGVNFAVNGMRVRSNNFMIDGQDSNSPSVTGLLQPINNPDTIAEFRIVTNQFLPEYGRAAGSVVNMITKSGSNEFHGSLYWFINTKELNTRSNLEKRTFANSPKRNENQFAGTFGGPVIRNRTFFFGSLLRQTDRVFAAGSSIRGLPTAEGQTVLRNAVGSLPQIRAFLDNAPPAQTTEGAPLRFNFGGQSFSVPVGTLSGAAPNLLNAWQWSARLDHRFNDKHSIFGRLLYDTRESVSGQAVPPGLTSQSPALAANFSFGVNSTLSARYFNEFRAGYGRTDSTTNAADPKAITIPSIEISEMGLIGFNAAATRTALGLGVNLPQSQILNNYQIVNNFSAIVGGHAVKMGIDFRRQEQYSDFNPTLRGRLFYNTLQDYVDDIAQTAAINVLQAGLPKFQAYRYYDFFAFFQDEWRIRPDFTLTYGVRYETPGNPFDWLRAINDQVVAANNNRPGFAVDKMPGRDLDNWGARVGFNYRPGWLGGKTVFRGGYSRTYDMMFNNIALNIYSAWPFTQVFAMPARSPNSFATIDAIRAGASRPPIPANPNTITRTIVDSTFRAPHAEQFAFNIQRELPDGWVVTAGYIGTRGVGLFQTVDGNPTIPGTNGTQRVDNSRGVIRLRANSAASTYHALQVSAERRLSRNFSMATHYTWSAMIDDASEIFNPSVAGEIAVSQDSFNRRSDRGRSTYDRPHRFIINGTYELPFFRSQQGFAGQLLGGWVVSGFLNLQSGPPFSPLNGADPGFRLSGIDQLVGNAIRPNVNTTLDVARMTVEDIWNAGGRTLFSQVTAASPIGNAGRNILRADGINNIDLAVNKAWRLWNETSKMNFRAEFYNLTNTRDFGIPNAFVNNAGFANQWNTDGGKRRIVLGLRMVF
jgi:hypothetical protein